MSWHLIILPSVSKAVGVARDDDHDSFRSAENAQLRRSHSAKLADGDRGQLPLVKYVPQLNTRCWRPPIDGLFPPAQPHQGASRPSWFNRLSHRCRHSRRRSPGKNKVHTWATYLCAVDVKCVSLVILADWIYERSPINSLITNTRKKRTDTRTDAILLSHVEPSSKWKRGTAMRCVMRYFRAWDTCWLNLLNLD